LETPTQVCAAHDLRLVIPAAFSALKSARHFRCKPRPTALRAQFAALSGDISGTGCMIRSILIFLSRHRVVWELDLIQWVVHEGSVPTDTRCVDELISAATATSSSAASPK